jgi:hypothetical protein
VLLLCWIAVAVVMQAASSRAHCAILSIAFVGPDKWCCCAGLQLRLLCRLLEVAQALMHLHSRNVIHGDLKTANVLLATCPSAPFGRRAKVTDFGISKLLQVSWRGGVHVRVIVEGVNSG